MWTTSAGSLCRWLTTSKHPNPRQVVSTSDEPRFDTKLALETAKKACDGAKPGTRWAQFAKWRLAWAYFHVGEREKATECVRAALDGVRNLKVKIGFDNLEAECEDALKLFTRSAK